MTPTLLPATVPPGYRFMLPDEAERLAHRAPIELFSAGMICRGVVKSFGDATMNVLLNGGGVVSLDLDDPDYWPDGEVRDRRPPMTSDGEFVALRKHSDDERDLLPELKASIRLETLEQQMRRVLAYIEQHKQQDAA